MRWDAEETLCFLVARIHFFWCVLWVLYQYYPYYASYEFYESSQSHLHSDPCQEQTWRAGDEHGFLPWAANVFMHVWARCAPDLRSFCRCSRWQKKVHLAMLDELLVLWTLCSVCSYGPDACFLWVLRSVCSFMFLSSVYIIIWLTVFPCPRPGVLPHCVRTQASLRLPFAPGHQGITHVELLRNLLMSWSISYEP